MTRTLAILACWLTWTSLVGAQLLPPTVPPPAKEPQPTNLIKYVFQPKPAPAPEPSGPELHPLTLHGVHGTDPSSNLIEIKKTRVRTVMETVQTSLVRNSRIMTSVHTVPREVHEEMLVAIDMRTHRVITASSKEIAAESLWKRLSTAKVVALSRIGVPPEHFLQALHPDTLVIIPVSQQTPALPAPALPVTSRTSQ